MALRLGQKTSSITLRRCKVCPAGLFRLGVIAMALLATNQATRKAECSIQSERRTFEEQQQQQQSDQQRQLDQVLAYPSAYRTSELELGNLINEGLALKRPLLPQSKRTRKLSAFMPMRGRKDGRDFNQQHRWSEPLPALSHLSQLREELDEPEDGILKLALEALANRRVQLNGVQTLARKLASEQEQEQSAAASASSGWPHVRWAASSGSRELEAGPNALIGEPAMMEAKLRRAFHPMRGKRTDVNAANTSSES